MYKIFFAVAALSLLSNYSALAGAIASNKLHHENVLGVITPSPWACVFPELGAFVELEATSCTDQPCIFTSEVVQFSTKFTPKVTSSALKHEVWFIDETNTLNSLDKYRPEGTYLEGQTYQLSKNVTIPTSIHGLSGHIWVEIYEQFTYVSRCFSVIFTD